jgi:hypothetical protein
MITREILSFCELEVKSFPLCIDVPLLLFVRFLARHILPLYSIEKIS